MGYKAYLSLFFMKAMQFNSVVDSQNMDKRFKWKRGCLSLLAYTLLRKKNQKNVQETAVTSLAYLCRRSPISIAAAIIYIISQLSDDKKALKGQKSKNISSLVFIALPCSLCLYPVVSDISVVTRVAEGTIRNSFKDLSPHLSGLIPAWYATEKDIKNLQP